MLLFKDNEQKTVRWRDDDDGTRLGFTTRAACPKEQRSEGEREEKDGAAGCFRRLTRGAREAVRPARVDAVLLGGGGRRVSSQSPL
ncbi:hypothetical protein MTO96_013663 [Rhipicephalus appendiculatus]